MTQLFFSFISVINRTKRLGMLVFATGLLFLLTACADEELSPPTQPVEEPSAGVLQPAQEITPESVPVITRPSDSSTAGYPAESEGEVIGEVIEEPAAETGGYPAADEGLPQAADGYPAPEGATAAETAGLVTFVVDSERSSAGYSVEEEFFNRDLPFSTAIGATNQIEGTFSVDLRGAAPVIEGGMFAVDLTTLSSDSNRRDEAIRNDWLESNSYPEAVFIAREVLNYPEGTPEGVAVNFQLVGDLTIRNITQEVTWDVNATFDGQELLAIAETFIFMADYGFEPPSVLNILEVTDGVTVTVSLTALPN